MNTRRAIMTVVVLALLGLGLGGGHTNGREYENSTVEVLVTYHCEVGHTHREIVEAWPNQQGVLMPATEAGNQVECLLPGTEAEVEP